MQGCISGQETPLDDLPSWKRELILRKRANVRMHGGFGLPTPTPPMAGRGRGSLSGRAQPSSSSLSGPHQAVSRSLSGPTPSHPHPPTHANSNAVSSRLDGVRASGGSGGERNENKKYAVTSEISSANIASNMHHKGLNDEGPRVSSPTYSSYSDSFGQEEDEELSYGPGIVSKLKNRYMSLAMRESRARPSLRRFSSLEDLLDTEPRGPWQERGTADVKARAVPETAATHRRDVMKRARSVDSLSSRLTEEVGRGRSAGLPKSKSATSRLQSSLCALGKDDVIIIETTRPVGQEQKAVNGGARTVDAGEPPPLTRKLSSSSLAEDEEMPPPDTVRQVKRMFEPLAGRPLRGAAARVAAHKAQQASKTNGISPVAKPALKAKPSVVPPGKVSSPTSPSLPVTIEEAKSSLRQVGQVNRASPRPTLSVRATAQNGDAGEGQNGVQERAGVARVRPGLTPVTASVTAPLVNGEAGIALAHTHGESGSAHEGVKRVSQTAVSNIRKESHSQEFNFTAATRPAGNSQSGLQAARPSSPTPTPLPASPVASHRVPTHSAFSSKADRAQESDRVLQENLKNVEKSRPQRQQQTAKVEPPARLESKVEPLKETKVELVKPTPTKVDPVKPTPTKVDPVKSTPTKVDPVKSAPEVEQPPKWSPKKVAPPKSEYPQSPVLSKPSPADELVRSSGKGSLVEAVNTSNKQASTNGAGGLSTPPLKTAGLRDRWHQQENNTIVFNFTASKKTTPDYIENDGIDLSKRRPEAKQLDSGYVIMPGWGGPADSSTDGDDDDPNLDYLDARPGVLPAPSGIVFEGEAVIINGRSNLQRQPKTKKLNLSFDDSLTQTYEYPSELSLMEEMGSPSDDLLPSNTTLDSPSTQGGLASYTPSKIQLGSTFELGVSRTPPPVQAPPPVPSAPSERVEEDYLRPADESETVTWSAESTSDMLF